MHGDQATLERWPQMFARIRSHTFFFEVVRALFLDAVFLHFSVVFVLAVLITCYMPLDADHGQVLAAGIPFVSHAMATAMTVSVTGFHSASFIAARGGLLSAIPFLLVLRSLSLLGRFLIAAQIQMP
jgi:hypothetical protein